MTFPFPKDRMTMPGAVPGVNAGGLFHICAKRTLKQLPALGSTKGRVTVAKTCTPGSASASIIRPESSRHPEARSPSGVRHPAAKSKSKLIPKFLCTGDLKHLPKGIEAPWD